VGTGFGETTYSPAYVVQFDPEPAIAEKIVLKIRVVDQSFAGKNHLIGLKNRFWPDDLNLLRFQKTLRMMELSDDELSNEIRKLNAS